MNLPADKPIEVFRAIEHVPQELVCLFRVDRGEARHLLAREVLLEDAALFEEMGAVFQECHANVPTEAMGEGSSAAHEKRKGK